ncbi:MAG: class I SAM-dependent methyltransferase [Rhodobacteraceae bacterium]|nr:class I SAM-dependent methyltransferase [Paracoccaceae bacterium]
MWEERFATEDYVYGKAPSQFLMRHAEFLAPGARALSVADGEGRNSVFMAERGLRVDALEFAPSAIAKAQRLAAERDVGVTSIRADVLEYDWADAAYDLVAGIFIQFVGPAERARMFQGMARTLRPGGLLMLHGYRPEQVGYGTGGPPDADNMYTEDLLRGAFPGWAVSVCDSYDAVLNEGAGHAGASALIDFIARKP